MTEAAFIVLCDFFIKMSPLLQSLLLQSTAVVTDRNSSDNLIKITAFPIGVNIKIT